MDGEETDGSMSGDLVSEKYHIPDKLTNYSFQNDLLQVKKVSNAAAYDQMLSSQESSAMNIPNEHSMHVDDGNENGPGSMIRQLHLR